jgi:hypothetical protein
MFRKDTLEVKHIVINTLKNFLGGIKAMEMKEKGTIMKRENFITSSGKALFFYTLSPSGNRFKSFDYFDIKEGDEVEFTYFVDKMGDKKIISAKFNNEILQTQGDPQYNIKPHISQTLKVKCLELAILYGQNKTDITVDEIKDIAKELIKWIISPTVEGDNQDDNQT